MWGAPRGLWLDSGATEGLVTMLRFECRAELLGSCLVACGCHSIPPGLLERRSQRSQPCLTQPGFLPPAAQGGHEAGRPCVLDGRGSLCPSQQRARSTWPCECTRRHTTGRLHRLEGGTHADLQTSESRWVILLLLQLLKSITVPFRVFPIWMSQNTTSDNPSPT